MEKKKRNVNVELARIIACLMVIAIHTELSVNPNGEWDPSRTLIAILIGDAVAIFWMITGAFLFEGKTDYKRVLARTAKTVLVPMLIWSLFWFEFSGIITDSKTIEESFTHSREEYINIIHSLLLWRNGITGTGHLWYCYVYCLTMVFYPVLKSFSDLLSRSIQNERAFLIIVFSLLIINDLGRNQFLAFSHSSINGVIPAGMDMLIGHIIWRHREQIEKIRQYSGIAIALFILLNLIRLKIQLYKVSIGYDEKSLMYWYSSFGTICAGIVLILCLSIRIKRKRSADLLCYVSSCTFPIYLIHMAVRDILFKWHVDGKFYRIVLSYFNGFVGEGLYTICITGSVFLCSVCIVVLIRVFKRSARQIIVDSTKWQRLN